MIHLSFDQAVALYVLFFIIIFIGSCVFVFLRKHKQWHPKEFRLWQCSICGFVYSCVFDNSITVCSRCGSFNKKDTDAVTERSNEY